MALVDSGGGDFQLKIKTDDVAGYEIKGLYIECDVEKNGASVVGETGYTAQSYGITDVANSDKRYMGPLHIKVNGEKCGWDTNSGETANEVLSTTVAEIDIVLDNEKATPGAFKAGKFTDTKAYIFKNSDGTRLGASIDSLFSSSKPVKCPILTYGVYTDAAMTTPFANTAQVIIDDLNDITLSNFKIFTDSGLKLTIYLSPHTEGHS